MNQEAPSPAKKIYNFLVTGASGALAGNLIDFYSNRNNVNLILLTRDKESLSEKLKNRYPDEKAPGFLDRLHVFQADCSNARDLLNLVSDFRSQFGTIDCIINNAGPAGPILTVSEISDHLETKLQLRDSIKEAVRGTVASAWHTSSILLPILSNEASIINISTIFSKTHYYSRSIYSSSKACLNQFSELICEDLKKHSNKNIRVNSILPGPIRGKRIDDLFQKMDAKKGEPLGSTAKKIQAEIAVDDIFIDYVQVVKLIDNLAFDKASGLNGSAVDIANGYAAKQSLNTVNAFGRPYYSHVDLEKNFLWVNATEDISTTSHLVESIDLFKGNVLVTCTSEKIKNSVLSYLNQDGIRKKRESKVSVVVYSKSISEIRDEIVEKFIQSGSNFFSVIHFENGTQSFWPVDTLGSNPDSIDQFLDSEISEKIITFSEIEKVLTLIDSHIIDKPDVSIVSNASLNKENSGILALKEKFIEQFINIWSGEAENKNINKKRNFAPRIRLIVPINNSKITPNFQAFSNWVCAIATGSDLFTNSGVVKIDVQNIQTIDFDRVSVAQNYNLRGLHEGRVAIITGGSEGIGGEITRALVSSGAKVFIAERSEEKLRTIAGEMIQACYRSGLSDPHNRVGIYPNCDVCFEENLNDLVNSCIERFGRVDYLINNVGITGAECMVSDMSLEKWNQTQMGNILCNYKLIVDCLSPMKKQNHGSIVLMSSYFGASNHGVIPYTNRGDYATAKAAQIHLVRFLSRFLGSEIRINANAPGPVNGARLNGRKGYPGLYQRRARLIIENKIINGLFKLVQIQPESQKLEFAERLLNSRYNELKEIVSSHGAKYDKLLQAINLLYSRINEENPHIISSDICKVVLDRITLIYGNSRKISIKSGSDRPDDLIELIPESYIEETAEKIASSFVKLCSIGRMPTDIDLAADVSWTLANSMLSGETIFTSAGFRFDGLGADELINHYITNKSSTPVNFNAELNKTNLILASSCESWTKALLMETVRFKNSKFILVTQNHNHEIFKQFLKQENLSHVEIKVATDDRNDLTISKISHDYKIDNIISLPSKVEFDPKDLKAKSKLPEFSLFCDLYNSQVTQHFLTYKAASLIENCKVHSLIGFEEKNNKFLSYFEEFAFNSLIHLTVTTQKEQIYCKMGAEFKQGFINKLDPINLLKNLFAENKKEISQEYIPTEGTIKKAA